MTDLLTTRRLGPDDLASLVALLVASNLAVLGYPDLTDDEIAVELARPEVEIRGWYDGRGELVACGWVTRVEDSERVEVDAYVHPDHDAGLGHVVVGWFSERGREVAAAAGHDHALLDIGVYRQDERTRDWLAAGGYEVQTTFTRMRIDLDGPADAAPTADGVTVRRAADSEEDRQLAYRLAEEGMAGHYGHVDVSYESFLRRLTERGPGFVSWYFAELEGDPVGVLVATRQFEPDEDAGYVRTLAVLPRGRGRGAAKALLRTYFDVCRREGRSAVLLHVDVANVTGALRLYESVGMRTVLEIDAWANRTPVAG